jgi:hypothetical protein
MKGLDGVPHLGGRRWYKPIPPCSGDDVAAHRHGEAVVAHEKLDVHAVKRQIFESPIVQKSRAAQYMPCCV